MTLFSTIVREGAKAKPGGKTCTSKNRSRSLGSAYPNHGKRDWGPERAPLGMTQRLYVG